MIEIAWYNSFYIYKQMGRYNSPDEHPFFPADLPQPITPRMDYPKVKKQQQQNNESQII